MSVCDNWKKTPNINPVTKRRIKSTGRVYKNLAKTCLELEKATKRSRTRSKSLGSQLEIDDSHWISERLEKSRRVSDDLFDVKIKPCISGKDSKNFISKFLDFKTIGQGSYGRVVRGITKSSDVVVMKEAYLKDPNVASQEDYISNLLNKLVTTKKCPNYIYTFFVSKCQSCNVKTLFSKKKKIDSESPCYIMFMESADVDLHDYSYHVSTFKLQSSILYQVLFAVYAAHHYYGIFHGDIKTENILLQKVVPGGYFKYQIGNESYYVKNNGIVAYLADFGVAEILSRKFVMPRSYFYGSRNAVVDSAARKWLPIYIPGNYVVKWKTSEGPILGTENEIMGEEESVALEETVEEMYPKYDNFQMNEDDTPPFEFYNDIQDVLRMFVGGKRTMQPGMHNSLPTNLEMTSLFKKTKAVVKYEQIFSSLYTLKYVLARYMIDELYRADPSSPKNHPNNVIATFKM
jgi:serine/threonine protein kinase